MPPQLLPALAIRRCAPPVWSLTRGEFFSRLVTETLQPLPEDRKCFRLINGVLVERTVKDVLPALKTNSDGLKQVLEELVKQYKSKQDEMDKWKVGGTRPGLQHQLRCIQQKNNIQVVQN